jgi:spore coat protein U-like protein
MKKLFAVLMTVAILSTMSLSAFAANTTGGEADITTSIAPTYTVTIPADVNVQFNATETAFGTIEVVASQIHPDKCIKVSLATDNKLENSIDATKVIPYAIKDSAGAAFTSATYLTEGDKTDLSIHITADDWNAAYAGDYSDTVTFTVSYVDKATDN